MGSVVDMKWFCKIWNGKDCYASPSFGYKRARVNSSQAKTFCGRGDFFRYGRYIRIRGKSSSIIIILFGYFEYIFLAINQFINQLDMIGMKMTMNAQEDISIISRP